MIKWSTKGFGRRWPEDGICQNKEGERTIVLLLNLIFHLNCVPSGSCGTPMRREARLPRGQARRLQGPALTGAPLTPSSPVVSLSSPSAILTEALKQSKPDN